LSDVNHWRENAGKKDNIETWIDKYLIEIYLPGKGAVGNHDVAQVKYACDIKLCFDNYAEELRGLLKNRSCPHEMAMTHTRNSHMPHGNSCELSHLSCKAIYLLRERYAFDTPT
jgi:hypothetical protein